jgi:hypothetical protein
VNASDNCPNAFNPTQLNTDFASIVSPGISPVDITVAMSDPLGDACDPDDDNDGLLDGVETDPANPSPPGTPPCASASGTTSSVIADTDGDRAIDGAECALGSDPALFASKPVVGGTDSDADSLSDTFEASIGSNPNAPDTDGDGLPDGVEFKGYGTSPLLVNSDGDDCDDAREVRSVNLDTAVNSIDLGIIASSFALATRPNMDINKNGAINSTDLQLVATGFTQQPCVPPD